MNNNQFQNITSGYTFQYPTQPPRPNPSESAVPSSNTYVWDIWIRNKSIANAALNQPAQYTEVKLMISLIQELRTALEAITDEHLQSNIEIIFCRQEMYQAATDGRGNWEHYGAIPNPSLNTWKQMCEKLMQKHIKGYENTYALKVEKSDGTYYAIHFYWIDPQHP